MHVCTDAVTTGAQRIQRDTGSRSTALSCLISDSLGTFCHVLELREGRRGEGRGGKEKRGEGRGGEGREGEERGEERREGEGRSHTLATHIVQPTERWRGKQRDFGGGDLHKG